MVRQDKITWYNKIATCVLTDCNVDYTSGQALNLMLMVRPVIIKMNLTFHGNRNDYIRSCRGGILICILSRFPLMAYDIKGTSDI